MVYGTLELISGPMFSGKTTELIRRIKICGVAKLKCIVIKYARDNRYSKTKVCSHDKEKISAITVEKLGEISQESIEECDVVAIDEGQFFPGLADFCSNLLKNGKRVIVAALNGDFEKKPFPEISNLLPHVTSFKYLTNICMVCTKKGFYSKRITDEKGSEVIGGSDKYIAVCGECFYLPLKSD